MLNEASEGVIDFCHRYFIAKHTREFINQDLKDKYKVPKNSEFLTFPFA